jgi:(heptosyl)LPS beta-1,4-glucosyltransferase
MPISVSAVIITRNEERNIARCIGSLKGVADEILVIDSGSTDKTAELCAEPGVRFLTNAWQGYSAQKNFGNSMASYDCILSIDADEALSEQLKSSISDFKNGNFIRPCSFNRCTNYGGVWIRHGAWYPDVKVRIFDRNHVKWEGEIHERLIGFSQNELIHLKGDLLHYSYDSIQEHLRQTELFSTLSAQTLFREGRRVNFLKLFPGPLIRFFVDYILRLGFLD